MRTSLRIGRFGSAEIVVHASLALGVFVIGGCRFAPVAWLGFALVLLVHELGHAVVARACGAYVYRIELHALGGFCQHSPPYTALGAIAIAWGGVGAQALLYAATRLALSLGVALPLELVSVFVGWNVIVACLNLIPFSPLDGAVAWRIVPYVLDHARPFGPAPQVDRARSSKRRPATRAAVRSAKDDLVIDDAEAERLAESLERARRPPIH